jgi:hypothetical protein
MYSIFTHKHTHITQPGENGKGGLWPSFPGILTQGNTRHALRCLPINSLFIGNEQSKQNKSYASDLGMT